MSVLITGATGFVGKNLMPFLEQRNMNVTRVSRNPEHPADISWEQLWEQPEWKQSFDVYIHLAGKAHDLKNASDASAYFEVNTTLTKKLFDHFLSSGAKDFIYFSSVKAAADSVAGILTEEQSPTPLTPYGKSKLQAEQYLLSQPLPAGKRVIIFRPSMIHGPGNKGNLNLLYNFVRKGIPYPLAAYTNKRSFLSVDNLCYAVYYVLRETNVGSGVYNLADDEALSTNELVILMARTLGVKTKLMAIPRSLLNAASRVGDVIRLPLNSERLKKLTESYVVSNVKIKNSLHIDRFPVSSYDGLVKTIQSFQKR